jgi:hypothetical protein
MKLPSKSIARSLRGQRLPGRKAIATVVSRVDKPITMIVPGLGGVEAQPGKRDDRSTLAYADAMSRFGGR